MGGHRARPSPASSPGRRCCYLVLPITIVLPVSVTDRRYLSLPETGISFRHYANLLTARGLAQLDLAELLDRHRLDLVAVSPARSAPSAAGDRAARHGVRPRADAAAADRPLHRLCHRPYRYLVDCDLLDRFLGVILAHAVTGIPYVVITVSTALADFDPRLEQAARGMGASLSQTLRWVILPHIVPGIASGAIFAFIHSWDELVMVLFIAGRGGFHPAAHASGTASTRISTRPWRRSRCC